MAEVRSVQYEKDVTLNYREPQLFENHKTIFSIIDEPPSWSDADDSFESMSDPDEEEEDSDHFFDAGEGAVIDDRSSHAASERSQSGDSTEDDTVSPRH